MAALDTLESSVGINRSTSRIRPKIHDNTKRLSDNLTSDILGLRCSRNKLYAFTMAVCSRGVSYFTHLKFDSMMELMTLMLMRSLNCLDVKSRDLMSLGVVFEMIIWSASRGSSSKDVAEQRTSH